MKRKKQTKKWRNMNVFALMIKTPTTKTQKYCEDESTEIKQQFICLEIERRNCIIGRPGPLFVYFKTIYFFSIAFISICQTFFTWFFFAFSFFHFIYIRFCSFYVSRHCVCSPFLIQLSKKKELKKNTKNYTCTIHKITITWAIAIFLAVRVSFCFWIHW